MYDPMKSLFEEFFGVKKKTKKVFVTKVTGEEIARFQCLYAQTEGMKKDLARIEAKITSDRNRLWADLCDKYDLNGKNVSFDEEGFIFEIVDEK